jgi:hypothetical protein
VSKFVPFSGSFHQCSIISFIYTLLVSAEQAGEASESSKEEMIFRKSGELERMYFYFSFVMG